MAMKPVAGKAMKMPMMGKSMMKKMTVKKSAKAKM